MKSLSIIILTYNQQQFTIDCLTSLGDLLDDESIEVILVDNGSSDGTVEAVKRRFPQVTLIENPVFNGWNPMVSAAASCLPTGPGSPSHPGGSAFS